MRCYRPSKFSLPLITLFGWITLWAGLQSLLLLLICVAACRVHCKKDNSFAIYWTVHKFFGPNFSTSNSSSVFCKVNDFMLTGSAEFVLSLDRSHFAQSSWQQMINPYFYWSWCMRSWILQFKSLTSKRKSNGPNFFQVFDFRFSYHLRGISWVSDFATLPEERAQRCHGFGRFFVCGRTEKRAQTE